MQSTEWRFCIRSLRSMRFARGYPRQLRSCRSEIGVPLEITTLRGRTWRFLFEIITRKSAARGSHAYQLAAAAKSVSLLERPVRYPEWRILIRRLRGYGSAGFTGPRASTRGYTKPQLRCFIRKAL